MMTDTEIVSKGVKKSEYDSLLEEIKTLIPGHKAFNKKVAKRLIKFRKEDEGSKDIVYDTAINLVSRVRNGHEKDWTVLKLMYEELEETKAFSVSASQKLLEPEVRFQKVK